ncbi:MAG: hypothetical protein JSR46_11805 [Verrucomicrobia bacterium]|nr:hypothetical protein [Verrucomicrobiota bacterium]
MPIDIYFLNLFTWSLMGKRKAVFSVLSVFLVITGITILVYRETAKNRIPTPSFQRERLIDIEFEEGLGKGCSAFELVEKSSADQSRYRLLKKIWQKNRPFLVQATSSKIPKVIHQIWLGPKSPPSYYRKFSTEWKQAHPDWEYHLWTDANIKDFDFELRDLFDNSTNYGEKADILRCELLYRYGGLYVDTDFECMGPFDELVERYDFFAGIEPPHEIPESSRVLLVSDALVGSVPGHPVLKRWKEHIRKKWYQAENECFDPIEKVLIRTFFTFGKAVEECIETGEYCNIIFPSTYFYPIQPKYLRKPPQPQTIIKKMLCALGLKKELCFYKTCPETLAIHHFAARWQKSTIQLFKEMHQEIVKLRRQQSKLTYEVDELRQQLYRDHKGENNVT